MRFINCDLFSLQFMNCDIQFIYCDFTVTIPLFRTLFLSGVFILLSLNLIHVMEPFVYLQNLLKTLKWKQHYGTYEL